MPDRLAEIVRQGLWCDWQHAIQAAINKAFETEISTAAVSYGAIVFFPPGHYRVTAPLTDAAARTGGADVHLVGSGQMCTIIAGNFLGFVIDQEDRVIRSGPGYLNRISASIGGASAGVKLPSGRAAA
jgi:hypothetical protein